jgi:integrase
VVKIRPVLRDVLAELRACSNPGQNSLVFGTVAGNSQNPSNVRVRVVAKSVERANKRLTAAGEAPLPALTPHGLRRSFASLLYGIGEAPTVVMQETDTPTPRWRWRSTRTRCAATTARTSGLARWWKAPRCPVWSRVTIQTSARARGMLRL